MPWDLKDYREDTSKGDGLVTGILYRGDAETKYSRPNQPIDNHFEHVRPNEIATLT
jgi:hypothetical protein